jgi:hypothetical protein
MFLQLEIFILCITLVEIGTFLHFTYWAIASLALSDLILLLSARRYFRIEKAAATIAIVVSCAVPVLSICNCRLFKEALADNGIVKYTAGNFALHYWPSLRLLFRLWQFHPHLSLQNLRPSVFTSLTFIPVHLLLLYSMLNNPAKQYKCPDQLRQSYFVVAIVIAAVAAEVAITLFVDNAMPKHTNGPGSSGLSTSKKYYARD